MPSDKEIEELKEQYHNMRVWGVYSTGYREESQLGDIPVVPFYDVVDALKDCEQRVAEETEAAMIQSFYWKPSPPHDQHYFADNICAYCVGYWEALSDARRALYAMENMSGYPEFDFDHIRDDFRDVIDSLKEKS